MQNKGALKFLVIALAIACAYQLSFTVVTRLVERKAEQYGAGDPVRKQNYLDSIKAEPVYNLGLLKFTYLEAKEKEINLGLDLRGGMNVMLQISVEDVIRALSNDSKDPVFNQAIVQAREAQKKSSSDFITLFAAAYEQLSNGGKLSYIFNTPELRDHINSASSNADVVRVLREQTDSAIANSFNVLRNRIDRFGVTQPNLQRLENGRMLVELPGVSEPERVRKLLQGSASLEFWATYNNQEIFPILEQANAVIRDLHNATQILNAVPTEAETEVAAIESDAVRERSSLISELDSIQPAAANSAEMATQFPLFSKLSPMVDPQSGAAFGGPVVGHALLQDTSAVNTFLNLPQVRALLPRDIKLLWGVKPVDKAETVFELYAIKANTRDGKAPLDGSAVVEAREEYSQHGSAAEVSMVMNAKGARDWARLTADNIGQSIAIVLDGYVYSAPRVNSEITGGRSSISGNFTINEARDLANVLKSGKLPAPARIIQETLVGPSLGQESINRGMMSFVLAFILVLLYMVLYYNRAGTVASIALLCNFFFLLGVLASFGAVLTLPGIAGIVLTMGMAVDANVIIYERVKEELRAGRGLSLAISEGYKHAYSAIIDCNLTSLITGIVLFVFGTGPVQGFATTLIIGILTSFFCAIFITRLIFVSKLEKGKDVTFSNKYTRNFLTNTKINFIKNRKYAYITSALLILITLTSLSTRKLVYGVDFSGGRDYVVRFDQPISAEEVRHALSTELSGGYEVKQFGPSNQMRIVTQYKYDDDSEQVTSEIEGILYRALSPLYLQEMTESEFLTTDQNPNGIISSGKVGPSVAHDIKRNSVIAVLFSLFAIALYIIVRFKGWQWGVGCVIALTHDALLTIGLFSLFHGVLPFSLEVDQSFIAAILTVIGYSVNDKVVIFDRIRENFRDFPKRGLQENINSAINSTLTRTINTSASTFVVLLAIFLFGGEVIRGFIFALMFGVVIGTLSSIFVATPIAYDIMRKNALKAEKS